MSKEDGRGKIRGVGRRKEGEEQGTMAAVVGLCGGLGKRQFTRFPTAFVCLTNSGTRAGKVSISYALL